MPEDQSQTVKRRRKSRSSSRTDGSWLAYWRAPLFGQHLFVAMVVLAGAYIGLNLWETRRATIHYHGLNIGDSESQVRYMLGAPLGTNPSRREYRYEEEGRQLVTRLSPAGRLTAVSCASAPGLPSSCPDLRGIKIGDTEARVVVRLGPPSREGYSGNDKLLHYDGLGLTLTLRRFRVLAIDLHEGGSLTGYLPRALWAMVP